VSNIQGWFQSPSASHRGCNPSPFQFGYFGIYHAKFRQNGVAERRSRDQKKTALCRTSDSRTLPATFLQLQSINISAILTLSIVRPVITRVVPPRSQFLALFRLRIRTYFRHKFLKDMEPPQLLLERRDPLDAAQSKLVGVDPLKFLDSLSEPSGIQF
jgi:hypothetical protein